MLHIVHSIYGLIYAASAVWQFPKILITLVRYYLLGMKQHINSFKWHTLTCSLYVKKQNYTTLYTDNPIKHSVLLFKLVKTVPDSSYVKRDCIWKNVHLSKYYNDQYESLDFWKLFIETETCVLLDMSLLLPKHISNL